MSSLIKGGFIILVSVLTTVSCTEETTTSDNNGGGGNNSCTASGTSGTVTVSWDANKETAVNSLGGGYIVYYSKTTGFNPADVGVNSKIVPYVSGANAPLSTTITTATSGSWFIRIAAKSTLNAPGSTAGSVSTASSQIKVCVQ